MTTGSLFSKVEMRWPYEWGWLVLACDILYNMIARV
jgi:hypothetical protein